MSAPPKQRPGPAEGAVRRPPRLTGLRAFGAAFALLLGSAGAVAVAQFRASSLAAWTSLACSAGAVGLSIVAMVLRGRR